MKITLEQLRSIKSGEVWLVTTTSLATVVSGWLTLLMFQPQWVHDWTTAKLIITSISLTLPVTALAIFAIVRNEDVDQQDVLFVANNCTFISFSAGLLLSFLFGFGFRLFLLTLVIFMFLSVRFGRDLIPSNKVSNKALQAIGDKSPQPER